MCWTFAPLPAWRQYENLSARTRVTPNDGGTWRHLADSTTDADGRAKDLGPEQLEPGHYKLNFATGDYYAGLQTATFFPEVDLVFEVTGPEHYHVPLLLSPFAYSTYRGS